MAFKQCLMTGFHGSLTGVFQLLRSEVFFIVMLHVFVDLFELKSHFFDELAFADVNQIVVNISLPVNVGLTVV